MLTVFSYIGILLFQSFVGGFTTEPNSGYLARNFTVQDGLPVNSVLDITQDKNGYLYFATLNGLTRFDGYEFVTFNSGNTPGILVERFVYMKIQPDNTIWLLSEGGFITRYQNGTFKTYSPGKEIPNGILKLSLTDDDRIWINSQQEIAFYDKGTDSFIRIKGTNTFDRIKSIDFASNDEFYVSDADAIYIWVDGIVSEIANREELSLSVENENDINYIGDHKLWVLQKNGFTLLNTNTGTYITEYQTNAANYNSYKAYHHKGRHLIGTTSGIAEINTAMGKVAKLNTGFPDPQVLTHTKFIAWRDKEFFLGNSVFEGDKHIFQTESFRTGFVDRDGSLWIATDKFGLFQLKESIITNFSATQNQLATNIYSITQASDSSIWMGSLSNGIVRLKNGRVTNTYNTGKSNLASDVIRYIYEDVDNSIYVGTWGDGLLKWKHGRSFTEDEVFNNFMLGEVTVEAMFRDYKDRLLIGTRDSTYIKMDENYYSIEEIFGLQTNRVRVIRQDNQNNLYLGTNGEGITIIYPDKSSIKISKDQGLSSDLVRDIFVQSPDTIWVATENKGLNRLTFSGKGELKSTSIITVNEGLKSNALHRIIDDGLGVFWISSNSGVMAISTSNLNAYADGTAEFLQVSGFDENSGMQNREANGGVENAGILTYDRKIWFPNQAGVTIFDIEEYHNSFLTPQISTPVIEFISTQDSVINTATLEKALVKKADRNLKVKFTAPNFINPERVVYRYQLSEIDEGWQIANQLREASYTNLNPGEYTFDVQSVWENGEVSQASFSITVPAYFYETGYFQIFIGLCFLGIGFMLYQYRVYHLKMSEKKLEKRVKQQTLELEKAADEKSRFFTGITHELKTPLSLILGPLDDFLEEQNDRSIHKLGMHASVMHRNGYRLKNLVDQILDVSKLNADAIRLTLQPCDITEFTKQIVGQFQSLLEQKGITLQIKTNAISEPIYVDKDAWERIIINLFSNAIKFSEGGSMIELSIMDKKSLVTVSIQDYGKGISAEKQQHVFEYLYQAEGKEAAEGTGIGLYLVKGLTERMGGTVSLESKENEGAKFIITLQKGRDHFNKEDFLTHEFLNPKPTPEPENISSKNVKQLPTKKVNKDTEKLLIVEDNPDFRNYLEATLREHYIVYVAENGKQGLEILEKDIPDLVISDVMMPVMNGFEFVQKLREQKRLQRLPVIFLSAKDQDVDKQRGLSTGADIYLSKPIRSSMLRSQISAILRREHILKQGFESKKNTDEPELVTQLREIVFRQLASPSLSVSILADALFMSRAKLYREWNLVSELTIAEFIKKIRFDEAYILIRDKKFSIGDAAQATGFKDPSYFATSFKKAYGYSPSEIK